MDSPYGIYISPYSGHLYVSDARSYVTNGYVYEFDRNGMLLNKYSLKGINPAHFLALPWSTGARGKEYRIQPE